MKALTLSGNRLSWAGKEGGLFARLFAALHVIARNRLALIGLANNRSTF